MSNTINLTEPQVDQLIGNYTGLQLERGVSATNLASFTIIAQIPYVFDQTTYSFVDTAGAPSDWYRVVRYGPFGIGTYSPAWPVTPVPFTSGDGARRSLKSCRRMLARKLGSLQVVTTTADGDSGGNTLVSANLANQIDANRYRGWWVMPTDGVSNGQVRVLAENALNPSSGQLTLAPPMTSQIIRGTQIELHKLLPPNDDAGVVLGLREALNLALAECWVLDRQAVATTGSVTYDLETLGDWLDPTAVLELYGPAFAGIPLQPFGGFTVRQDAEQVALDVIGMASGATMTVELTRQGDSYMKVAGAWTGSQRGFVLDDDESLFQPEFLTQIAIAHCYEALANSTTGVPSQRYQAKADDARRNANILKWRTLPHPPERSHGGYTVSGQGWMSWLK